MSDPRSAQRPSRSALIKRAVVLAGSLTALAVPFLFSAALFGEPLPRVLTQLESDSLYYLTIIKSVIGGDLFAGNPYILEHRDAVLPALLLPFWMSAIPGWLGLPINGVYLFNALFYSGLTGWIVHVLLKKIRGRDDWIAVAIAVLGIASLSNLILRPAIMQTVYPAFGAFMIALLGVLRKPDQPIRLLALGCAMTVSFYLYPHLWVQTFSAVGVWYLVLLWRRDLRAVKLMTMMGLGVVLACLPQIIMMTSLLRDPELALLSARNGVLHTHAVLPLTVLNNKFPILALGGLLALRIRGKLSADETLLALLCFAILIAAFSNVVTGIEIDAPTHPWRPGLLVTVVGIAVFLHSLEARTIAWKRLVAGACLGMLLFTTVNRTFLRLHPFGYVLKSAEVIELHEEQKGYAEVFNFLNRSGISNAVFLADERMSTLIPLYTDNFVLFSKKAGLHVIPDAELQERFLVYYDPLFDERFLRHNTEALRGVHLEHAMIYANAYPEHSLWGYGKAFALGLAGKTVKGAVPPVTQVDLMGGQPYVDEMLRKHADISDHYEAYLQKYKVRYAIQSKNGSWKLRIPDSATVIYDDDWNTIYQL